MMVYSTLPARPTIGIRREIDRLFDDVFGRDAIPTRSWVPAVDIHETTDTYRFTLDLPGMTAEQVDVTADSGVLRISGERTVERTEQSDARWHVAERFRGRFERTFQLPTTADEQRISATFAHGVLTVTVPKAAVAVPRKIAVETK